MVHVMTWFANHRRRRIVVSTQVTNVAVQKVGSRLGFEPSTSSYSFHKWF